MGEKTLRIDLTYQGVTICSLYPIKEMDAGELKRELDALNYALRSFRFVPNTELLRLSVPINVTDPVLAEGFIEEKLSEG